MESKLILAIFVALVFTIALASATSPTLDTSAAQDLTLTPTDTVGYLRSKRQFGYPGGFGGGSSFANAQASAVSGGGGYGGFPGFGGSSAVANAGANSFGFGK